MTSRDWDAPRQGDVQVLSTVRQGKFFRSERLEDSGRIQSWVLAGERGAVEVRGTGPGHLRLLVHVPDASSHGHTLLFLMDPFAFPVNDRCTVLEGGCLPVLLTNSALAECQPLSDPWSGLERLYWLHLEDR